MAAPVSKAAGTSGDNLGRGSMEWPPTALCGMPNEILHMIFDAWLEEEKTWCPKSPWCIRASCTPRFRPPYQGLPPMCLVNKILYQKPLPWHFSINETQIALDGLDEHSLGHVAERTQRMNRTLGQTIRNVTLYIESCALQITLPVMVKLVAFSSLFRKSLSGKITFEPIFYYHSHRHQWRAQRLLGKLLRFGTERQPRGNEAGCARLLNLVRDAHLPSDYPRYASIQACLASKSEIDLVEEAQGLWQTYWARADGTLPECWYTPCPGDDVTATDCLSYYDEENRERLCCKPRPMPEPVSSAGG